MGDAVSYKSGGVEIFWLKHAGFKIKTSRHVVYIDPFLLEKEPEKADLICISHSHQDHLDPSSIAKILSSKTHFVCARDCQKNLEKCAPGHSFTTLAPGETAYFENIEIHAKAAYNLGKPFHPKENGWLGFLMEIEKKSLYFLGDSDALEEFKEIQCDIALMPVSGIYVMDALEAAMLANEMGPKEVAIPMHWGSLIDDQGRQVGTREDAVQFCEHYLGKGLILKPLG